MPEESDLPMEIDTSRPHTARIYDYYLGGKNHFAADRETAAKLAIDWPSVNVAAREQRRFLGRAVRYLAGEAGIRQFLDIGTGLPTTNNVHDVAQAVNPSCRVVYVDNDPLVLTHARALLTSAPEGRTAYIHADLRDPGAILSHATTREVLDFTKPIALMLVGILHFIPDEDKPAEIIATLVDALPSGSYLVATHITVEHDPERVIASEHTSRGAGRFRQVPRFQRLRPFRVRRPPPGAARHGVAAEWRPTTARDVPVGGRGERLRRRRPEAVNALLFPPSTLRASARGGRRVLGKPSSMRFNDLTFINSFLRL